MTERPILKKSSRKGSLVRRVLWGVTIFVVLPLFIHTFFLYFREYQEDVGMVRTFLELIGRAATEAIEETIQEKKEALESLGLDLDPRQMEIFRAQKIPARINGTSFTFVDEEKKELWVGRNISSTDALGLSIDLDSWITKWEYLEKYQFPVFFVIRKEDETLVAGKPFPPNEERVWIQNPIDDTGLFLRLSVPLKEIQRYEIRYYAFSVFTLLVLIGVMGSLGAILFARRLSKPFDKLCQTMERVSEGALHVRYMPDKMGFEINALGEQFNQTLDELFKRTHEAETEKIHRERLAEQLKIGHEIQRSMLPESLPAFSGLDLAPGYVSALEVSGDFYDLFQIDANRLLFVVADGSGKGISACLYGLGFRSALRAFARTGESLSEIMRKANDLFLLDTGDSGFFVTAWLGLYHANTGVLEYCSQGHPPALLKRENTLQELSTGGIPFGVYPFTKGETQEMKLQAGDFLLLYTDGIIEAHNSKKQLFGMERLRSFLRSLKEGSSSECVQELLSSVNQFSEETPQYDDMTLLAIKFFR